jgi:hypothetical protein
MVSWLHCFEPKASKASWRGVCGGGKLLTLWQAGNRESEEEARGPDTPFKSTFLVICILHLLKVPPSVNNAVHLWIHQWTHPLIHLEALWSNHLPKDPSLTTAAMGNKSLAWSL